jgi:hypothetical protein
MSLEIPEFLIEDIKALAEIERQMDSGEVPFVMYGSGRCAVSRECMDALGLKQGQTINGVIFLAMCKWNLANCHAQMAINKAAQTT